MATASKDTLNNAYTFVIIGVVLIIFFAGYFAGRTKKEDKS
jgi:LPXTG-motif cell wall-anchored protein